MAEHRMDDATRARLMSLMPCASKGTYEWTPDSFKDREEETDEYIIPKEQWPKFKLRALNNKEHSDLRKALLSQGSFKKEDSKALIQISEMMHESVRKIVVGWENVIDVLSGDEFEYEQDPSGGALKEKWDFMPDSVKSELFQHVCRVSGLIKVDGDDRMEISRRGF
ncbi:MAG: hypothetical protein GF414_01490 [Candidatus Altiarchaeales archaeon]|nr:hypothetical protein [Candidatus Altiarchaeales archaeon]